MALNYSTSMPPAGDGPYAIDRNWCLGDSLVYINANSKNFDTRIDANTTALASASATLNTTIASTSSITTASIPSRLSVAKAWACYSLLPTGLVIHSSYNIQSATVPTRLETYGQQIIFNFTTPLTDRAYAVLSTHATTPSNGYPLNPIYVSSETNAYEETTFDVPTTQSSPSTNGDSRSNKTINNIKFIMFYKEGGIAVQRSRFIPEAYFVVYGN